MRMSMISLVFCLVLPCVSVGGELSKKPSGEIYGIVRDNKGVPHRKATICCQCKKEAVSAETDKYGIYRIGIDDRGTCVLWFLSAESIKWSREWLGLGEIEARDACKGESMDTGTCKRVRVFPSPTRYDMVILKEGEEP